MSTRYICFLILSVVLSLASPSLDFTEAETTSADNVEAETETEGLTQPTPGYGVCDGVGCAGLEDEEGASARPARNVDQSQANQQAIVLDEYPGLYNCVPSLTLDKFPLEYLNRQEEYVIPLVRIPRCGGCCKVKEFACKPTATTTVTFQVHVKEYQYPNKTGSASISTRVVPMENHTACQCGCNKECEESKVLNINTCECVCKEKRLRCNNKYYRPKNCKCQCNVNKLKMDCDRNATLVDQESCSCITQSELKMNRSKQKTRPSEVVPEGQESY